MVQSDPVTISFKLKLATHDPVNIRKVSRSRCLARRSQKYFRHPRLFFVFHPRLRRRRRRIYGFCWQWWEENSWQLARTRCHSSPFIRKILSFPRFRFEKHVEKITWYFLVLCPISYFFFFFFPPILGILLRSPRGIKQISFYFN